MAEVSGGEAIKRLLGNIDVDKRMSEIRDELQTARGTKRTHLNREMKYLQQLKANKIKPEDAFMISKIPVIPPSMRPIYTDEKGTLISSDINALYRDVALVNDQIKKFKDLPEESKADLRVDLYDGVKAVQGVGDPISENQSLKGIFKNIAGVRSPKGGFFQGRVIRSRQNLSGRSIITLGNDLDIDEVGLPEEMAWPLYRDFAVREMVGLGYKKADALAAIRDRTDGAKHALELAMSKRPVWLNRGPSLHRHSIMAMNPVLKHGRAIQINPLVTKGYNADFDGDQMSVYMPVTHDAVEEVKKRKPSDMLFTTGSDKIMMVPSQSSALGLFLMSRMDNKKGQRVKKSFESDKEALKAIDKGEIEPEDVISVGGTKTTGGRVQIDQWLPADKRGQYEHLGKKNMEKLLSDMALEQPQEFGKIVHGLRQLGDDRATKRGFSIGIDDLQPRRQLKDKHLSTARTRVSGATYKNKKEVFEKSYSDASDKIEKDLIKNIDDGENTIGMMMVAGSRGSPAQARQIFASPVIAQDHQGNIIPVPIDKSYSDGLDESEYFSAAFGARAGAVGRSHQTAKPGALAKEVLASVYDSVISSPKSDAMSSIELSTADESDVLDRFASKTVQGRNGKVVVKKGQLITPGVVSNAKKSGVNKLHVYTPLNSYSEGGGVPPMAYGVDEKGQMPEIGTNIGVLSGHAMTEPISQMTLDAFHSGATGGTAGRISKFGRIEQLFKLPEDLPGKATLSQTDGEIDKINDSPVGGWDVSVHDKGRGKKIMHYVSPDNPLSIKEGDRIKRGDRLSDGPIKPQELAELKDIHAAQEYLVNEIKDKTEVNRRAAEVVVGSMTNHSQIDEADILDEIIPGDILPNWKVDNIKSNRVKAVDTQTALGR